jgi:hypothetical protein
MAIRRYIDEVADIADVAQERSRSGPVASRPDAFDLAMREVTQEPLLGPRQAAFVDALIERIRSGSAMTDVDNQARVDLMRVLGLE